MSLYEATTPLPKPWLNISAHTIQCDDLTVTDEFIIDGELTINETASSSINGALSASNPLLALNNTTATAGTFNNALQAHSVSGAEVKIITQNNPIASANNGIWSDGIFAISTFQSTSNISLNPNGVVAVNSIYDSPGVSHTIVQNLQLPTAGGTPSNLNYYESTVLSQSYTGIWAAPQTGNIFMSRLGDIVTLTFNSVFSNASISSVIGVTTPLPVRFRPSTNKFFLVSGLDNNADGLTSLVIASNGTISFSYNYTNYSGLATVGTSGFFATGVSYSIS